MRKAWCKNHASVQFVPPWGLIGLTHGDSCTMQTNDDIDEDGDEDRVSGSTELPAGEGEVGWEHDDPRRREQSVSESILGEMIVYRDVDGTPPGTHEWGGVAEKELSESIM